MCDQKKRSGFTLAELLIIVAIVAVLIAIGFPVFSAQLEKSREATDLANVRSAYAKVMTAALTNDTANPNEDGVICVYDRWYLNVPLKQKQNGWQMNSQLTVGGITSDDTLHWVGLPAAGSICTVSYSAEGGAVLAWVYNFSQIMRNIIVKEGPYKGKTVTELLYDDQFQMLESSGSTGQYINSEIKHQLGLNTSDEFSYKILPAKGYGKGYYEIYISNGYTLKTGAKANQGNAGQIKVTGYIYKIEENGASTLIQTGRTQEIDTYTNANGQEKMDVYGNQNKTSGYVNNRIYIWD